MTKYFCTVFGVTGFNRGFKQMAIITVIKNSASEKLHGRMAQEKPDLHSPIPPLHSDQG